MKELWRRVLLPVTIPVAALAVIAFSVLNVSRVLIAIEESNSPGLVTLLASLIAGAIFLSSAYMSTKEAERRKHNSGGILAMSGVVLLVCGLWGYQAIEAREGHGEEAGPDLGEADLVVHAFDLGFDEKTLSAAPGDVVIEYQNKGAQAHTLVFEGGIAGKLEVASKGATDKAAFTFTSPGDYVYFCDIPGHRQAGMEGVLTVAEGGGGGGEGGGGGGAAAAEFVTTVGNTLAFDPAEFTAPAGPVKITMKAAGALAHTLLVDGAPNFKKLSVAKQGDEASGVLEADPGTYAFYCDVPGHRQAGMEGKITIG